MAKIGRKKLNINWEQMESLCAVQCTIEEISEFFHVSVDTIERRCKEERGVTFREYFEKKRVMGKISLRRSQLKLAETSAAMAIFLGKNYLGQIDNYRQEHTGKNGKPIEFTEAKDLTDEQLAVIAASEIIKQSKSRPGGK